MVTRDPALLVEQLATLWVENTALRAQNAALQGCIRELEARLGQDSFNSSRPPSSDPPRAPARPKAPPSGRKRGGQPGHRGAFRELLLVEQVDEIVAVVPERCRHCEQPFPETAARRRGQAWRHQVVELLPLAVRVTEYPMAVRCGAHCGRRTRASLPPGVPRRPFGARLTPDNEPHLMRKRADSKSGQLASVGKAPGPASPVPMRLAGVGPAAFARAPERFPLASPNFESAL